MGYHCISGGKDGGCSAATVAAGMAARARLGATRWEQQRQKRGQRNSNSCEDNSKGDTAREGNVVTTTGYRGNGGGEVGSDVVGESNRQHGKGSGVPRQRWWRQQGQQQGQQQQEQGKRWQQQRHRLSSLSYFLSFVRLLTSQHSHEILFLTIHNCHTMTQITVCQYT